MKKQTIGAIFFVIAAIGTPLVKYFIIGNEVPVNPTKWERYTSINYALIPTEIPKIEQDLKKAQSEVELRTNTERMLRNALASRGDILERENLRKETIIRVMDNNLKGLLKGKSQVIYEASTTNGYPPYLQCAIIIHETGNGTSKALKQKNNVGGIFQGSHLKWYESIDASIWDMAWRIKKYYVDEGRTTIESFGAKYCPVGAKNDPTGINKYWVPSVNKYYIKMLNEGGLI